MRLNPDTVCQIAGLYFDGDITRETARHLLREFGFWPYLADGTIHPDAVGKFREFVKGISHE